MENWKSRISIEHPCWHGFRELLDALDDGHFPGPEQLSGLLPDGLNCLGGQPVQFVPSMDIPGFPYEKNIYETGHVSTRPESWHDLFNALVWCRLPQLKVAMNAVHYQHLEEESGGRRGKQRDALTLLDESGVIVTGSHAGVLEALAARDWQRAFVDYREAWIGEAQILVCGHAILEKFLDPYKALTAHALYLHSSEPMAIPEIDELLADALLSGEFLSEPKDLSPLPLMGIPGWWPSGAQDETFYADEGVFRPAR